MSAASEKALQDLHALVARLLEGDLKDSEKRNPQLYAQAVKFLKDNGIQCTADNQSPELEDLAETITQIDPEEDYDDDTPLMFPGALG